MLICCFEYVCLVIFRNPNLHFVESPALAPPEMKIDIAAQQRSRREANSQTVRGTLLIPHRTAMIGSFPLNGTHFQVNEVFADHESSLIPIDVPRSWLWNVPRRTVYFGTSIPRIFKGLTTEGIQYCFWRGKLLQVNIRSVDEAIVIGSAISLSSSAFVLQRKVSYQLDLE